MPEGPSIVILKEEAMQFKGQKILRVSGNSKIGIQRMKGQKIIDFKSWGKHFLICFDGFTVRIHLMMFGSYRINEKKDAEPRISFKFKKGELNFYSCAIKYIEEPLDKVYDWQLDIMSDQWNNEKALNNIKALKGVLVCDVLLDQNIFAGSGNIIKNEVLFRIKVHPETIMNALPIKKKRELIAETRNYALDFYRWKKAFELKKHWQVYRCRTCPRCNIALQLQHLGKFKRRTFFCNNCQKLYELN